MDANEITYDTNRLRNTERMAWALSCLVCLSFSMYVYSNYASNYTYACSTYFGWGPEETMWTIDANVTLDDVKNGSVYDWKSFNENRWKEIYNASDT